MSADDFGCGKLGGWESGVSGIGWVEIRDAASILLPQRVYHSRMDLSRTKVEKPMQEGFSKTCSLKTKLSGRYSS